MKGESVQPLVLFVRLIAWSVAIFAASIAVAQTYPARPIRLVTSEAGGGNDIQARLIAQGLSIRLGQRIVVDNRPSGVIPGEICRNQLRMVTRCCSTTIRSGSER